MRSAIKNMEDKKTTVEIKIATIFKIIGAVLLVWLLYYLRDILAIFLAALLLAAVINPFANWFEKRRIPRALAVLIIYLLLGAFLGLIIFLLAPPIISDSINFVRELPARLDVIRQSYESFINLPERLGIGGDLTGIFADVESGLSGAAEKVFKTAADVFGGFVALALILVLAFYLVTEKGNLKDLVSFAVPAEYEPHLAGYFSQISQKISSWVKGQLIVGLVMGVFVYIGLTILGVKYALAIALLAALLEFIPYVGPVLSAIPAVILGLTESPVKALMVVALFWILNRLENDLLIPKVMRRATGLNSVITLLSIVIGFKLGGILGIILAVPTVTAGGVFVKAYFEKKSIRPPAPE